MARIIASRSFVEDSQEITRKFFETNLAPLGLTGEQIRSQTLDELEGSLERVNEAIANANSFGLLRLQMRSTGAIMVVKSSGEASIEVGILPLLLARKKLILDRINALKEESIRQLKALSDEIVDDASRSNVENRIKNLEEESQKSQLETKVVETAQILEESKVSTEVDSAVAAFERRAKVWLSFLERESVATIVGSFLLVVLTVSIVVAMFIDKTTSEIVKNGFLVLLGYFFGQTVSKATSNSE